MQPVQPMRRHLHVNNFTLFFCHLLVPVILFLDFLYTYYGFPHTFLCGLSGAREATQQITPVSDR